MDLVNATSFRFSNSKHSTQKALHDPLEVSDEMKLKMKHLEIEYEVIYLSVTLETRQITNPNYAFSQEQKLNKWSSQL